MMKREWTAEEASKPEALLTDRSLEEVLRVAAASAVVEAEEEIAAVSKRPTVPVFLGEPWR